MSILVCPQIHGQPLFSGLRYLKSAFGYYLEVYGMELPTIDPWTSRPAAINIVLNLCDVTTKFVPQHREQIQLEVT
jgi:hypothetical protein